jgi:hypothetical protein
MAAPDNVDRRLQDRQLQRGEARAEDVEKSVLELPDSADNAERASAEELEELREGLEAEKPLRDERIARAIASPAQAAPPIASPLAPLDDEL